MKSALAGSAGAAAAVIYNNAAGGFNGTLGAPPRPEGDYIASISITQELGTSYVESITGGATINATVDVTTDVQNVSTYNVLATTKSGDHSNKLALGAHTDSVLAGPGINDDGSGTVGILEVAKALSKYEIKNAVTFGFWAGEEEGLLGSTYYVENLPANESALIRAYLNFDMVSHMKIRLRYPILIRLPRLLHLITCMPSMTATVALSTSQGLLAVLSSNLSSRTISPRQDRTSLPQHSTVGQIMVPSLMLAFPPEALSLEPKSSRRRKRLSSLVVKQALHLTCAITPLATMLIISTWRLSSCMARLSLRRSQLMRHHGKVSRLET